MTDITDVEAALYAHLKAWADAQSPALRIKIDGARFRQDDRETYLHPHFMPASPRHRYLGANTDEEHTGLYQVNVIGPESRKRKAFKLLAVSLARHFWPTTTKITPTIGGGSPRIEIIKHVPKVYDLRTHDTPGELAAACDIYWRSKFNS